MWCISNKDWKGTLVKSLGKEKKKLYRQQLEPVLKELPQTDISRKNFLTLTLKLVFLHCSILNNHLYYQLHFLQEKQGECAEAVHDFQGEIVKSAINFLLDLCNKYATEAEF